LGYFPQKIKFNANWMFLAEAESILNGNAAVSFNTEVLKLSRLKFSFENSLSELVIVEVLSKVLN
jgi:hypothetical protein